MEPDLRSRILLMVERFPGLHLRDIQRRVGCSPMLAEYHLNVLEKLGLVQSEAHGRYRDFFPARAGPLVLDRTDKRWLGLLRRPPILAVTLLLLEHGSLRPADVAQHLGMAGSTAGYQVRVAQQAGLTTSETIEGMNLVRLSDPDRVLALLQAYHPTPDAISEYANLWSRVFRRNAPAPPREVEEADPDVPPVVQGMPRAVQGVHRALRDGPQTQKELCEATGHARRTVYAALRRLEGLDLIASRVHLLDTRQTKYWLKDEPRAADTEANG